MRLFIVEDDASIRAALQATLRLQAPDVALLGFAASVPDALRLIPDFAPDLILLDLNLPGGTGFDVLEALGERRTERGFEVIFLTVRRDSETMLKAINRYEATGYLTKPFEEWELFDLLDKVRKNLARRRGAPERTENRATTLAGPGFAARHPVSGKEERLRAADLFALEADGAWTFAHTARGKFVSDKRLGDWERELGGDAFFRPHDSYLVNLRQVIHYDAKNLRLYLANGLSVPVARRRKTLVEERLANSPFPLLPRADTSPPPPQTSK